MQNPSSERSKDQSVVAQLRDGDIDAFEVLFNRYSEKLFNFSFRYLGNKQDAEEVVQNVFFKIWTNRACLKPELSFNAYLIQIGKSIIYKMSRKDQRDADYYQYLQVWKKKYHSDTEEAIQLAELRDQLFRGIDHLPKKRREVFLMSRFEGLSLDEIALRLAISKKTVKNHLTQAMHDLKSHLREYELLTILFLFLLP